MDDYDDTRVYYPSMDERIYWDAYVQRNDILNLFLRRACKGVLVDVILRLLTCWNMW